MSISRPGGKKRKQIKVLYFLDFWVGFSKAHKLRVKQISRTSRNQDLEDDFAEVKTFLACSCSGSPRNRATIPNKLRILK